MWHEEAGNEAGARADLANDLINVPLVRPEQSRETTVFGLYLAVFEEDTYLRAPVQTGNSEVNPNVSVFRIDRH